MFLECTWNHLDLDFKMVTRNFKSVKGYHKWLAYGHIHGVFRKRGNQRIKIRGRRHKVKHRRWKSNLHTNSSMKKIPLQWFRVGDIQFIKGKNRSFIVIYFHISVLHCGMLRGIYETHIKRETDLHKKYV